MKPQQLAFLLKVKPVTLRRWAREEFREFLSPNAQGGNNLQRSFDARDIRIFTMIAKLRLQNISTDEIRQTLRTAQSHNWVDLPPLPEGAEDEAVPMMPVEAALTKVEGNKERYELQLQSLTRERDELRAQLDELKDNHATLQSKYYAVTEQLIELNRRLTFLLEEQHKNRAG